MYQHKKRLSFAVAALIAVVPLADGGAEAKIVKKKPHRFSVDISEETDFDMTLEKAGVCEFRQYSLGNPIHAAYFLKAEQEIFGRKFEIGDVIISMKTGQDYLVRAKTATSLNDAEAKIPKSFISKLPGVAGKLSDECLVVPAAYPKPG